MKKFLLIIASLLVGGTAIASCEDYPFTVGGMPIMDGTVNGQSGKFIATEEAAVDFDDRESVLEAIQEAELMAKGRVSKFLQEEITTEDSREKYVETQISKTNSGNTQQATTQKNTMKKVASMVKSNSQSMLRGIVMLGNCYSAEDGYVRVSVGMKPEFIEMAENFTGEINASIERQDSRAKTSSGSVSQSASSGGGANAKSSESGKPKGFSNTKMLDSF